MNFRVFTLVAFVNLLGLITVGDGSGLGLGLLSPLLPVAHITGHAGLMAHGLTGAALLKLKAAAALAGLFLASGRGIDISLGDPGHHHHHQYEEIHDDHHGYGWARKRRDVTAAAGQVETVRMDQYDPNLDEVLSFDQLGCGMRLVCELAASPFRSLGEDERLILELFGRDGKAPLPMSKASKGKLTYSYASILGANAKDGARACGRVYGHCPYTRVQIMQSLRETQI